MKFYLTKSAQRAAESGQAPVKTAKGPKVVAEKAPKPERTPRAAKQSRAPKEPRAPKVPRAAKVALAPAVVSPEPLTTAAAQQPIAAPLVQVPSTREAVVPTTSVHASSAATTTAVLEAPAAPSIESPALPAPTLKAARPVKAAAAPKERRGFIAIGGQPRVDLLPLEVRAERKAGLVVRRAWLGVAAAVVLMGIVTGASTLYANNATTSLASTQAETTALTTQQSKYSAVKTTQSEVGLIQAAQSVGGSTDVDWAGYLEKVALTVPTGVSVTSLSVSSTSPVLALAQPMSPLQGQRVATLSFEITATSLPAITTWLNTLPTLKGYVDASASSASSESGGYTASVTLHINQKVFTNTYTKGN